MDEGRGEVLTVARIILLTGEAETPILSHIIRQHNPSLDISVVHNRNDLLTLPTISTSYTRLISFCSSIVVPAETLNALPGPSYNFHPGPPERPGRYPSVFALYEGADRFGVTVHEMNATVDSGAIVAAEWFAFPPEADLVALESLTLTQLASCFADLHRFSRSTPIRCRAFLSPGGARSEPKPIATRSAASHLI